MTELRWQAELLKLSREAPVEPVTPEQAAKQRADCHNWFKSLHRKAHGSV